MAFRRRGRRGARRSFGKRRGFVGRSRSRRRRRGARRISSVNVSRGGIRL